MSQGPKAKEKHLNGGAMKVLQKGKSLVLKIHSVHSLTNPVPLLHQRTSFYAAIRSKKEKPMLRRCDLQGSLLRRIQRATGLRL